MTSFALSPRRTFRVRYALQLATLVAGRIRGRHTVRGTWLATTDEPRVLLADLYDQFRPAAGLLGIRILSVRRLPAAATPLTANYD